VAYHDEIVDLDAGVDVGFADGGAVDGGVGLDLDVVVEDGDAGLEDLVPCGAVGGGGVVVGEAEAVGPDDGTVLQGDVVAEAATLADDGVGVSEEVAADLCVGIDHCVGQKSCMISNDCVVADDDVGADVGFGADLRGGSDDGGGMDSWGVGWGLVEEFEGVGEGEVGIPDAEGCCGNGAEGGFDQHGGGLGGAGKRRVPGIGDEGELAGAGVFEAGGGGDFGVGIAVEGCAEMSG